MTDLAQAQTQMEDIIQWWPILDDVADSLLGITGHGAALDGIRHDSGESATELAVLQLEQINEISVDLTTLALKMGWKAGRDGNPRLYIFTNVAWGRDNLVPAEFDDIIADIHKRIARLTGHAPRPTGRTCPGCGADQLKLMDDERLRCDTCDLTRSVDEVTALTTWRVANSSAQVTRREAAQILGESENTIKQRIRRRNPDYTRNLNAPRRYHIGDLK